MLRWRLILGAFIIAALVALCWMDFRSAQPGTWLLPVALAVTAAATQEYLSLLRNRDLKPVAWPVYVGNLMMVASIRFPQLSFDDTSIDWLPLIFILAVLASFLVEMQRYEAPGHSIRDIGLSVLGLAYVGVLMSFVVRLRFVSGGLPLLLLITVVKSGDIGAYTVGRLIGRTRMAPTLSPGKTWEGAFGAILFACLGAAGILFGLGTRLIPTLDSPQWWWFVVLGCTVGTAGMLGDLAESLLKRDMGAKDSSRWMPGFGGVLDIMDSILFAAPVAYLAWILLQGTNSRGALI